MAAGWGDPGRDMASSRPDQLGTEQRSDKPIAGKPLLGRPQAAQYYRLLRESRLLTAFPQAVRGRLGELAVVPRRLWHRIRSARSSSASAPLAQKAKQSPSSFFIVLESRDKVTASIAGLAEGTMRIRGGVVPSIPSDAELTASLRRAHSGDGASAEGSSRFLLPGTSFRGIPRWLLIGSAMVLLVVIPLVVLQVVSPRFRGLGALPAQVSSEPSSGGSEGQTSGSREASPSVGGATIPGADFTGAYVLEVRHLSSTRTMITIRVPSGVEGNYQALVNMSQASDFQCVVLEDRTNELFCIGPRLPTGKAEISIFRLNDADDPPFLVFEVSYFIVEDTISPGPVFPGPVPPVAPYGAGFTWPDRFNDAEVERETASNSVLAPASALVTMLVMGVWLLPRPKSDSDRRRTR